MVCINDVVSGLTSGSYGRGWGGFHTYQPTDDFSQHYLKRCLDLKNAVNYD